MTDTVQASPSMTVRPRSRKLGLRAALAPYWLQIAQAALLLALLAGWQIASDALHAGFWISSPNAVVASLISWGQDGTLAGDVEITLIEAGAGFVIGATAGGVVGFLFGWFHRLGDLFEPFILAFYSLPKIALAPLFVLWFGIGVANKIMFSALLVFS